MSRTFTLESPYATLRCMVERLGPDLVVSIGGGDEPHLGCCILALPRPSLSGSGMSATLSTLNRLGHKDDIFASAIAKELACRTGGAVACCCGIHIDEATPSAIEGILALQEPLIAMILETERTDEP